MTRYNWNIVESGVNHHKPKTEYEWNRQCDDMFLLPTNLSMSGIDSVIHSYSGLLVEETCHHTVYSTHTQFCWWKKHVITLSIPLILRFVGRRNMSSKGLRQVGHFLRGLWFSPSIKLPRYNWNIVESGVKHHQTNILGLQLAWF
jgi:hypothetical protein